MIDTNASKSCAVPPSADTHASTQRPAISFSSLELLDAMARALRMLGCRCVTNVPYAGCAESRVVMHECARCRCLREYDEMKGPA